MQDHSSIGTIKKKKIGKKIQLRVLNTFSALFMMQDHSSMELSQIQKGKRKKQRQLLLLDTSISWVSCKTSMCNVHVSDENKLLVIQHLTLNHLSTA